MPGPKPMTLLFSLASPIVAWLLDGELRWVPPGIAGDRNAFLLRGGAGEPSIMVRYF